MQPFDGVDVVDLTQSVAGPLSTQFLDALGADVVKVEPPGGDTFREFFDGGMFSAVNLGHKRSICVDLKTETGHEVVHDLVREADVVVESFRPGVLERFDLDYESVAAENEDVVYCSLTGYGQDGPRSDWAAYDPMIQAATGLMTSVTYPDEPPSRIGASLIDYGTGVIAAFLMASALYGRDRTGEGEYIDVSLFDTGVWYMGYWIARYSATGDYQEHAEDEFAGAPPGGGYYAADDEPFYMAVLNDQFYERLCRGVGRDDLFEDERYRTKENRLEHQDELRATWETEFRTWDREELLEALSEAGVPAAPVQTVADVVEEDPQAEARDLLTDSYNHQLGEPVKTSNPPFRTSDGHPDLGDRPPERGEHTREVLAGLGFDDDEIDRAVESGAVEDHPGVD